MADNDFSAQFEKISDRAETATDTLRAAGDKTNDKLAADAAAAGEKAAAAANRFKDKADGDREKVSSQWQDIRDKWQAHVAKVQRNVKEHKERFDAHEAATDADMADAYAFDAIDFAQAAASSRRRDGRWCDVVRLICHGKR